MQIRWVDVNWTDQPGVYQLANGRQVQVSAVEIARWKTCPEGAFDTYWYPGTPQRAAQFTLADFHPVPESTQEAIRYSVEVSSW